MWEQVAGSDIVAFDGSVAATNEFVQDDHNPVRVSVATLTAHFIIDPQDMLWFSHCEDVTVRAVDTAFEAFLARQKDELAISAEVAQTVGDELIRIIKHAKLRGVSVELSFSHFDQAQVGYVDAAALIKGLSRLGIGLGANGADVLVSTIGRQSSLHFTADRGWLTPEEAAIGNLFVPHFAKAVDINRPFMLLKHRFQAILSVLNRFQIGLVVTNSIGEIVISNHEADAYLSARNGLETTRSNHIQLSPEPLNQNLSGMIRAASAPEQGPNFVSTMTVPKRDGTQDWLLDVQPLTDIHGNIDGHFQGAMIFIIDPERDEIISTTGMQKLFNLTDAESDICALLTAGLKAKDVADSRNVSLGTVRNQIQTVLDKTQTNSQLDLVRLALKVNLPVETPS